MSGRSGRDHLDRFSWIKTKTGRGVLTALVLAALLAGCGERETPPVQDGSDSVPPVSASRSEEPDVEPEQVLPALDSPEALEELTPADFGHFQDFLTGPGDTYALLGGDGLENTVFVSAGQEPGPVIYIVGGTHGDELAGWYAGTLLRQVVPQAGTVYVVAPLNRYGAEHSQRKTREERDLNRNFPGDPEGCDAERIAWAVFADIRDKEPDLVLDLHEAIDPEGSRDDLRGSMICQDMSLIGDLVLELLSVYGGGERPLTLYGSPPAGSLNRVVTQELGIPVITLETSRDEELSRRVERQLGIVESILSWYGMV